MFDGGLCQALASTSDLERSSWMDAIRQASYERIRAEFNALRQCIERKRNHKANVDLQTWRLQRGYIFGKNQSFFKYRKPKNCFLFLYRPDDGILSKLILCLELKVYKYLFVL